MVYRATSLVSREGRLLLAAAIVLALPCTPAPAQGRSADQRAPDRTTEPHPTSNAEDSDSSWQYPAEPGSDWVTPPEPPHMPDPELPPDGMRRHPFRHMGLGQPLEGTSWLNRPLYVELFVGSWFGDTLVPGHVEADTGFFSGLVLGNDLSHYWGCELRLSLAYIDVEFDSEQYTSGRARTIVGDLNVLYYPWGDARWRPYGSLGLGVAGYHFVDLDNMQVDHTGASLPIGFGVKYLLRNWLALRIDIKDNVIFGGKDVGTTSNWSLTGGIEMHWGSETADRYYPW